MPAIDSAERQIVRLPTCKSLLKMQSRVAGQLLLDPTSDESYHEDGAVLMAMMTSSNLVRYC